MKHYINVWKQNLISMKESISIKQCLRCDKPIHRLPKLSQKQWEKKKYCSNKCTSTKRQLSEESRLKISLALQENVPWNRGEDPYCAGHYRVKKKRGQPSFCVMCETTVATRFDWANITKNYLDPFDYIRLCRACHLRMDRFHAKKSNT